MRRSFILANYLLSVASYAASVDGIQVGTTTVANARQNLAQIANRFSASTGKNTMAIGGGPSDRADDTAGVAAATGDLGELRTNILLAGFKGGTTRYLRYSIPPASQKQAIETIAQKYRGKVFQAAASDETGISDWFFVSLLDVTWIHKPEPDGNMQLIVGTHEVMQSIVIQDLHAEDWAKEIETLRTQTTATSSRK